MSAPLHWGLYWWSLKLPAPPLCINSELWYPLHPVYPFPVLENTHYPHHENLRLWQHMIIYCVYDLLMLWLCAFFLFIWFRKLSTFSQHFSSVPSAMSSYLFILKLELPAAINSFLTQDNTGCVYTALWAPSIPNKIFFFQNLSQMWVEPSYSFKLGALR